MRLSHLQRWESSTFILKLSLNGSFNQAIWVIYFSKTERVVSGFRDDSRVGHHQAWRGTAAFMTELLMNFST